MCDGMTFYLQDASSGQPGRAVNTIATVTLSADAIGFAASLLGVSPNAVSANAIADVIQRHLGDDPRVRSVSVRGSMILICEADLPKGTVVFKADLDEAERTLALEGWAYERVRQLGVPCPRVLACDASKRLFPSPYLILERVPGQPLDTLGLAPDKLHSLLNQVGGYLRLIHSVHLEGFGYLDEAVYLGDNRVMGRHETWRDAVLEHLEEAVYLVRHGLLSREALASLRARLARSDDLLRECKVGHLLHGDLGPGHVFVDVRAAEVTGIIDFAERQAGDTAWDLARIALELEPDQLHQLLDGYQPDGTAEQTLPLRIALLRPLVVIAYAKWAHTVGLIDEIPRAWRRYFNEDG